MDKNMRNYNNISQSTLSHHFYYEEFNFCTICSDKYILKLLALHKSLCDNCFSFHLWILSMDDASFSLLNSSKLSNVTIINIKDVEDDKLKEVKGKRSKGEYCWTLKAPLIEFVQNQTNNGDVVYIDSDMYFFKDPSIIFEKFKNYSIYLCPQRDLDSVENIYGKYQAGIVGFKGDFEGKTALRYWKEKCLDWCYHKYDEELKRYGDQKYLDELPFHFKSVFIETNYGIDAAPWNCIYSKEFFLQTDNNELKVNNDDVVAFHFSCINIYSLIEYDLWNLGNLTISQAIIDKLYVPYIKTLVYVAEKLLRRAPFSQEYLFNKDPVVDAKTYYKYDPSNNDDSNCYNICSIVSRSYLIKAITLYNSLLINNKDDFHIWFCAIDKDSYDTLNNMNLEKSTVIRSSEVEKSLAQDIRITRNDKEYCWTLKSIFAYYLLDEYNLPSILYCDSDLFFFEDLKYIYQEWGTYSFFVCSQLANERTEYLCGGYQAGLLGFKNDTYSRKILSWLKEKCINWCYDTHEDGLERWGDQKYLDKIPNLFENIKVSRNLGINTAPWNLILNNQSNTVKSIDDKIFINNYILCVYHFGSLKIYDEENFDIWYHSPINIQKDVLTHIYTPYLKCLIKTMKKLEEKRYNLNIFYSSESINAAKNLYNII